MMMKRRCLFWQVRVLYVRNLRSDVTDAQLKEMFEQHGPVERVKRVKSYGFVHFNDREQALKAMGELNGTVSIDMAGILLNS
jgi:RNA recognition motif-containing protein